MKDEKNITCFFTGHRFIQTSKRPAVISRVKKIIDFLYSEGYRIFVCGGAMGFDTIAALAVLDEKKSKTDIRLCLVLPCENQTDGWKKQSDKDIYDMIKNSADEVEIISKEYTDGCMKQRNIRMADRSNVCIAYYDKRNMGGTAFTVNYVNRTGIELINLYD